MRLAAQVSVGAVWAQCINGYLVSKHPNLPPEHSTRLGDRTSIRLGAVVVLRGCRSASPLIEYGTAQVPPIRRPTCQRRVPATKGVTT